MYKRQVWSGSPIITFIQQGAFSDRELINPNISFIGRANLPLPPAYATVNNNYDNEVSVDGEIRISFRTRPDAFVGQETLIVLMDGATEIFRRIVSLGVLSMGVYPVQNVHISSTLISNALSPATDAILNLSVSALWQSRDSWQAWQFAIDWSSRDRSGERQGWNFNWGNDWGGGNASGFGYDWGNDWGD